MRVSWSNDVECPPPSPPPLRGLANTSSLRFHERQVEEAKPMWSSRRNLRKLFGKSSRFVKADNHTKSDLESDPASKCHDKRHFRIEVVQPRDLTNCFTQRCLDVAKVFRYVMGVSPETANQGVIRSFLLMVYRISYAKLLCLLIFMYLSLCFLFSVWFYLVIWNEPSCIDVDPQRSFWPDSWALAWTTLSTVGYGHIYQSLRDELDPECGALISGGSLCAFCGSIFSELCGAIIFSKIVYQMADAPIVMSEAVVIRYKPRHENKPKTFDNLISDSYINETIYPFPVLEIQLVTKYANKMRGGELVDASFQVTVMDNEVNEEDESFIVDNKINDDLSECEDADVPFVKMENGGCSTSLSLLNVDTKKERPLQTSREHKLHEWQHDKAIQVFRKNMFVVIAAMKIEIYDEMCFKRSEHLAFSAMDNICNWEKQRPILKDKNRFTSCNGHQKLVLNYDKVCLIGQHWVIKHKLNHHSPLLKDIVRAEIIANAEKESIRTGRKQAKSWPSRLADADSIRKSLRSFKELRVMVRAISNSNASDVYSIKSYTEDSILIGYEFANLFYWCNSDQQKKIDFDLINDIIEQDGGGSENLGGRCLNV